MPTAVSHGTLSFWRTFASGFRASTKTTSPDVPARFMIAINGRGYQLDLTDHDYGRTYFGFQSIAISRAQSDVTDAPSEASLSREDLWRRAFESWHHGAGQAYRDRTNSDEFRFRSSLGVDPWTRDSLTLLPSTSLTRALTATTPLLTTAATHVYATDAAAVYYSTDGATWAAATYAGGAPLAMCCDGSYVYVADGTNIYRSTPGGAFAAWSTLDASLVAFVNGRLMAAGSGGTKNILYNQTDPGGALPTYSFTHPDPNWVWTAFASGQQAIYAAGYVGDHSAVYSIGIRSDGTGLDVPVVALDLPDGELCYSLAGYLDFLAIGTSAGLRLAALGSTLTAGSPLAVPAVRCLEGQDRFIWFGWTNYDATHTGLGRADLSVFTSPITAAYASDLMAASQGAVTAVVTFRGLRVFAVSGVGVYVQQAARVATGNILSGWVTYGLPDRKVLETIDVRTEPLDGTVSINVRGAAGLYGAVPVHSVPGSTGLSMSIAEQASGRFEMLVTLTNGSATGPNIDRITMLANPSPSRTEQWTIPIMLGESVKDNTGTPHRWQAQDEVDYIRLLADSGSLCSFQLANRTYSLFVTDYLWRPTHPYEDFTDWNGTLTVLAKAPSRRDD